MAQKERFDSPEHGPPPGPALMLTGGVSAGFVNGSVTTSFRGELLPETIDCHTFTESGGTGPVSAGTYSGEYRLETAEISATRVS